MKSDDEILDDMMRLREIGIREDFIEELFNGYDDPRLAKTGYSQTVDNILDFVLNTNCPDKDDAIRSIEGTLAIWGDMTLGKRNLETLFDEMRNEKKLELESIGISKNKVREYVSGYMNEFMDQYDYSNALNHALNQVRIFKLKGRDAEKEIDHQLSMWAEFNGDYNQIMKIGDNMVIDDNRFWKYLFEK